MKNRGNQSFTWMKAALPMIWRVYMAMPHGLNAVSVNIMGRQRGEPMWSGRYWEKRWWRWDCSSVLWIVMCFTLGSFRYFCRVCHPTLWWSWIMRPSTNVWTLKKCSMTRVISFNICLLTRLIILLSINGQKQKAKEERSIAVSMLYFLITWRNRNYFVQLYKPMWKYIYLKWFIHRSKAWLFSGEKARSRQRQIKTASNWHGEGVPKDIMDSMSDDMRSLHPIWEFQPNAWGMFMWTV